MGTNRALVLSWRVVVESTAGVLVAVFCRPVPVRLAGWLSGRRGSGSVVVGVGSVGVAGWMGVHRIGFRVRNGV